MSFSEEIVIAGARLFPDPSGALYWAAEETLIVADLHLEKGSAFARRGILLPPYDSRATLARLEKACSRYAPRRVIALGDSFHDRDGPARLPRRDRDTLSDLCTRHSFIWIAGNHDPAPSCAFGGVPGSGFRLGPIAFSHEPSRHSHEPEIAGHLHPCMSLVLRGRSLRRRCFVSDGVRAVLPAFGAYAGGLDVGDDALRGLFVETPRVWLIGDKRVHALGPVGRAQVVRMSAEATAPEASASKIASKP